MLEIEKIKEFIEKHSRELAYEIYGGDGFANNVICKIDYTHKKSPRLAVYCTDTGKKVRLFSVYETWFKIPTKKHLETSIKKSKNELNESVCHHWSIHTLSDGKEQFVLSNLSLDNYLKAIEISKKYFKDVQ